MSVSKELGKINVVEALPQAVVSFPFPDRLRTHVGAGKRRQTMIGRGLPQQERQGFGVYILPRVKREGAGGIK